MAIKTPEQIKAEFERKGLSLSAWARQHGLRPAVVFDLLSGRQVGRYGQAHKAAVLLGLKDGEIVEDQKAA